MQARLPATPAPGLALRVDPADDDPWRYVAVKLPAVNGRKLSEIADLRCSKRTRVALELLQRPPRALARDHRAGESPQAGQRGRLNASGIDSLSYRRI